LPANDQTWLTSAPYVSPPSCFKTTAVGPADHFSVPSVGTVVEGTLTTGPTPQMTALLLGEKKNEVRTSLTPDAATPPGT